MLLTTAFGSWALITLFRNDTHPVKPLIPGTLETTSSQGLSLSYLVLSVVGLRRPSLALAPQNTLSLFQCSEFGRVLKCCSEWHGRWSGAWLVLTSASWAPLGSPRRAWSRSVWVSQSAYRPLALSHRGIPLGQQQHLTRLQTVPGSV